MSRTTRNYGMYNLDCHGLAAYEYAWIGLGETWRLTPDLRDTLINGYDGCSPTYYYVGFESRGFRHNFQKKTRKFYKRQYHHEKRRRMKAKLRLGDWDNL